MIRTPELLGKSVVCPRCQSIVHVPSTLAAASPSAWASGNNPILPPSFDSTAVTKVQDALDPSENYSKNTSDKKLGDQADASGIHIPMPLADTNEGVAFLDWEELPAELLGAPMLDDLPYGDPAFDATQQPPSRRAIDSLENSIGNELTATRPLQPTSDWVSPSTARKRLVLLVGTTALAVSIAAVVLFMMFLNSFTSPKFTGPKFTGPKPEIALNPVPAADSVPEVVVPLAIESSVEKSDNKEPVAKEPVAKDLGNEPFVAPEPAVVLPTLDNVSEPMIPASIASDLNLGMSAQNRATNAQRAVAPTDEVNMIPPAGLAQFAPVFELGMAGFSSDAAALEPTTLDFSGGGGVVDIGLLTHPAPIIPEPWDNIKSTPILRLRIEQKPLSQVLLILGQLSNSGLGWDTQLLHFSPIDSSQQVSLDAADSTVEVELTNLSKQVPFVKQIVAPRGLVENNIVENRVDKPRVDLLVDVTVDTFVEQVRLLPLENLISSQLPSDWSLEDLAPTDESISQWNRLLKTLFTPDDSAWTLEGKSLTWNDEASLMQRASMAVFLDQAREIYGYPAKSGFFSSPADSAVGTSNVSTSNRIAWAQPIQAYNEAYKRLKKTGSSVFAEVISSPSLLDAAARECEIGLLFDWPSLQSHGFSHSASSLSLFKNRTWPQIAKRIMDQFDLVAVVDGPQRLILTTLAQQRRWPKSTILPLRSGESIESIGESFRILSPTNDRGLSILSVTPLPKKDPKDPVDYVVVRHCPPNTKQLELLEVRRALHITSVER